MREITTRYDRKLPKRSLDNLTPGVVLLGFVELRLAKWR